MPASLAALLSLLVLDPSLRKLRYRAAWLLYGAIVLIGSIPGARADIGQVAPGIVLHSVAYGCISFLLFTGSAGKPGARALRAILTVALMGAFDEFVQSFLPYRTSSVIDWMVDCNAAVIACALLWAFLPTPADTR